jgi:hypothetical protein
MTLNDSDSGPGTRANGEKSHVIGDFCNPVVGSAHPTTDMSYVYVGGQCPPYASTRLIRVRVGVVVLAMAQIKEVRTIEDHLGEKMSKPPL